jgi:hypothetical protein
VDYLEVVMKILLIKSFIVALALAPVFYIGNLSAHPERYGGEGAVHPYGHHGAYGAAGYHPEARAYGRGAEEGAAANQGGNQGAGNGGVYVEEQQAAPLPAPPPQG